MENMKAFLARGKFAVGALAVSGAALADGTTTSGTSVIDAGMKASLVAGYQALQATTYDIVSASWPYLLAITALMMAPKIVKKMAHLAGS